MSKRTIEQLKDYFRKGKYPTESQFADLMDSYVHKDSKIPPAQIDGLTDQLNDKFTRSEGKALGQDMATMQNRVENNAGKIVQLASDISDARKDDERFFLSYLNVVPFDGFMVDYEERKEDLEYGIFFFRAGERPDGNEKPGFELFAISNALFSDSSFFTNRFYSIGQNVPKNNTLFLNSCDGCLYRFDGHDLVKAYLSPEELTAIPSDEIINTMTF